MSRKRKLPEGLRLRGKTYHADFYGGGRRVRKALSTNLDAAVEILNDLKARADKGDFGLLDNDYSLADLQEQYLKYCRQTRKPLTTQRYQAALETILPQLGAQRVSQFTVDNLLAYRQDRLDAGTSPRTVNLEVGALLTMLRWAVNHSLIGANPLAKLKPLSHDYPKEGRALSDEEVWRLLDKSPQPWRDIWYALLVTGLRKGELISLTFADIDHENRELIIHGSVAKNHRERRIPIDTGLWATLCRLEAERDNRQPGKGKTPEITERVRSRFTKDHVFVSTQNTPLTHRSGLYHAFMRCCKLANIQTKTYDREGHVVEHVDVHSLRRTFATSLIVGGADPKSVQELLGHRTLDTTMRIYTKIHSQTKRQALAKLTYGHGTIAPDHLVRYRDKSGSSVQNGQDLVTSSKSAVGGMT